jgi:hypothetical protein
VSQVNWLAPFPNGGSLAGGNAAGGTFAVNSKGDVIIGTTYGNTVAMISPTGTVTTLGTYDNVGPITIDSDDNIYVGGAYNPEIIKVPYVNGAYAALSAPSSATSPAACTGSDTTECNFGGHLTDLANGYYFGEVSIAFDKAGDFFYALTNGNTAPNAIFECTAACLSTGTPGPALIFQEPTSSDVSTTGQLTIGEMAIDSAGNLFFTDSAINSSSNGSFSSNLKEIMVDSTSATGYAATATVLYNEVPASPGAYDDQIDGLAINLNPAGDTVYMGDEYNGVFAIPDPGTAIPMSGMVPSNIYAVSTQGAKILTINSKGDLYLISYENPFGTGSTDTVAQLTVGSITVPSSAVGTASSPSTSTNPVTTLINDDACTGATAPSATFTGTSTTATATVATTGTCSSSMTGGGAFATHVSFTPSVSASPVITMTATDQSSKTGVVSIGVAGQPAASQTITFINPGVQTVGTPLTLDATASSGLPVTYTSETATICTVSGATATFLLAGSCTIDANQAGNDIFTAAAQESQSFTVNLVLTPQTITFANPGSQLYGSTLTLGATASSGLPVTYTSTTTSICTVSGSSATFIDIGTCTIEANQAGNSTYATAPQVTVSFAVNPAGPAATPTFSPAAGEFASAQTVTISDTTPGAAIYYTTDGSTPTTASTPYTAPVSISATETLSAIAVAPPGYTVSATASGLYAINPSFTLAIAPSNIIVRSGGSGTVYVTVLPVNGFSGQVSFSCSGATCSFSPATLTVGGGNEETSIITVGAGSGSAALQNNSNPLIPGTTLAVALCLLGFKKRRSLQLLLLAVVCAAGMGLVTGCSSKTTSTTVTITATSAVTPSLTVTESGTFTLVD